MRPRRAAAIERATQTTAFAGYSRDGSDGTRTRDLRRDRLVHGSRRLTTIDAQSLYSCGLSRVPRSDSAWLSEAVFRGLLPVCCPDPTFGPEGGCQCGPSCTHQELQVHGRPDTCRGRSPSRRLTPGAPVARPGVIGAC